MNHHHALAALRSATGWRKSTRSDAQNCCLEVTAEVPGWIGVRDTKLGVRSPVLAVSTVQWTAMLTAEMHRFSSLQAPSSQTPVEPLMLLTLGARGCREIAAASGDDGRNRFRESPPPAGPTTHPSGLVTAALGGHTVATQSG